jgi:hypothetical protein
VGGLHVLHALPGRLRVRPEGLKGDGLRVNELRARLAGIDWIGGVEINQATGSVLMRFDPATATAPDFLARMAEALGSSIQPEDPDIRRMLAALEPGGGVDHPGDPLSLWEDMNAWVSEATAGAADLRTTVPLGLLLLGLYRLLMGDKLALPAWQNYLWFAFSSLFMLNRDGGGETRPKSSE